ncbi:MAG: flagellar motor protein [Wenzhouxiangella sp.]|jgi:chemotaxis protein MotA|nr:flagellar motor protein [Wenzhouxiangella sp.]
MDLLSIIGFLLASVALIGGSLSKGSGIVALLDSAAFLIVIFGTAAAGLIHTPMHTMKHAWTLFIWVFKPPRADPEAMIEKVLDWSQIARRQGLLGLEAQVENEPDPFVQKAMQLMVDGGEPDVIQDIMEVELDAREEKDLEGAKVFESFGIYAPTLGIIGAVLGLMAVMQNLADPSKLGPGISAAFVATIYGIASANLFFLPVAGKLKSIIKSQTQMRTLVIEGVVSIARGENPRNIETKLRGFLA